MGSSFAHGSDAALQGRGGSGACVDPARQLWRGGGPLVRGGSWRRSSICQQPQHLLHVQRVLLGTGVPFRSSTTSCLAPPILGLNKLQEKEQLNHQRRVRRTTPNHRLHEEHTSIAC